MLVCCGNVCHTFMYRREEQKSIIQSYLDKYERYTTKYKNLEMYKTLQKEEQILEALEEKQKQVEDKLLEQRSNMRSVLRSQCKINIKSLYPISLHMVRTQ